MFGMHRGEAAGPAPAAPQGGSTAQDLAMQLLLGPRSSLKRQSSSMAESDGQRLWT